jgi:hypothetical protein
MQKITHSQNNKIKNILLTILVAISPRTPKAKRKTLAHMLQTNKRNARDAQLLKAIAL